MYPGAVLKAGDTCDFNVWSPSAFRIDLKIFDDEENILEMKQDEKMYWSVQVENIKAGTRYLYRINGEKTRPDPASNYQPDGVHGPSQIVDHRFFNWQDHDWKGIAQSDAIIYELHIGAFAQEGTFLSAINRLDDLRELGINAIEIMPVSQFPGSRNWGYDGVYPYAPANCYGTPDNFKTFISECHHRNLAVILDVVYNHFGPEGNYLNDFGAYFTDKYKTPWGNAINYDEAYSDQVRNYFIQNALFWLKEYHIDGLRLDAVHQIYDFSASHILSEINKEVLQLCELDGKRRMIIAESDLNDVKVIKDFSAGGYNCTAQWSDDFHHSLHSFLTKEASGYYSDFGKIQDLTKALKNTFVYNGNYSEHRLRKHGNDATDQSPDKFVIFIQNHDQVGNRAFGERLTNLVEPEALKLAAAILIFSPYIPLIFMGEEYGEDAPFLYFVEHGDPNLVESVRQGRKQEFAAFKWMGEIPDPQLRHTFEKSKLKWDFNTNEAKMSIRNFYKELIILRKKISALNKKSKNEMEIECSSDNNILTIKRWDESSIVFMIFNLLPEPGEYQFDGFEGKWRKILDSANDKSKKDIFISDARQKIKLERYSVIVFEKEEQ